VLRPSRSQTRQVNWTAVIQPEHDAGLVVLVVLPKSVSVLPHSLHGWCLAWVCEPPMEINCYYCY
jgi:hypothetical protein